MNNNLALLLYKMASKYRGEKTFEYLDFYRNSQWWTSQELQQYHTKCIEQLINYVNHNIPFYKEFDTFINCPITDKKSIKQAPDKFLNTNNKEKKITIKNTAGSTGEPLRVFKDAEAMAHEQAITYRGYEWAGIHPGDMQIRFWGIPLNHSSQIHTKLKDFALNRIRFSAFQYSDEYFSRCYTIISKLRKPCYFYGYASMIYDFAEYLSKHKKNLTNVISVITTSDLLTISMRELIQNTFNSKVFVEYGCSEVGTIAHEADNGKMYINSENLFLEIVDCNGEIKSQGHGELLVTELHNYLQPLIRYKIGDTVKIEYNQTGDKRGLQVLTELCGRSQDVVIGPNNKKWNAMFFSYIMENAQKSNNSIKKFQIIQNNDVLHIKIVPGNTFSEAVKTQIKYNIDKEFHHYFVCNFEYCDEGGIEKERNGKVRLVKRISPI